MNQAKIEFKEKWPGLIKVIRGSQEIGEISGGEKGIFGKKFCDVANGSKEASFPEWSYWLKDLSTMDYVNFKPLVTINQAKALAEYHFNKLIVEVKTTTTVYKAGRARNGNHRDAGTVIHIVPEKLEGFSGDWFNKALCGTAPGRRSYGWSLADKEATCPSCLKKTQSEN